MTTPAKLPALTEEQIQQIRHRLISEHELPPLTPANIHAICDLALQSIRQPDAGATPRTDAARRRIISAANIFGTLAPAEKLDGLADFIYDITNEALTESANIERELAALSAPAGSRGWISVGERLPDTDGRYLVWWKPSHAPRYADRSFAECMDFTTGRFWRGKGAPPNVTHWMPLPTAPEEK